MSKTFREYGYLLPGLLAALIVGYALAQGPTVTQSYGLTLERDDFPPTTQAAGPFSFSTPVAARSSFAIVFRNGLLQRVCPTVQTVPPTPCDYSVSGNVTATFPASLIGDGDLITMFYYR
jgi:hypothetical protein